ncbi:MULTISPECIES: rhodanese-like domain-containing protein [Streptomyces]|uniref:Rhodanese-like domain-containing protein n=1 Tax=Streptomyces koyangensis TaxID=188770 RepID=A0A385D628_9ACTN|nr:MULTISPECIES: rhodanese-like domain-containing protein [Streptomyces]AXQ53818.1 rhodanese-like domain-containing protein [Streptomyces koyangensis]PKR44855.1 transporter [Streptomyces sp. EAG2]
MNATLTTGAARERLHTLVVIDVRTPGEYAGGHLPGAHNIPLDDLPRALPDLRAAADRGDLLVVCASGARSQKAGATLASQGIPAASLEGGTAAWASAGGELHHPATTAAPTWAMDRQVRLTAGSVVLLGLLLGVLIHPAFQLLAAGIAAGLVYSALSNSCAMASLLGKLPYNRPARGNLDTTLAALRHG